MSSETEMSERSENAYTAESFGRADVERPRVIFRQGIRFQIVVRSVAGGLMGLIVVCHVNLAPCACDLEKFIIRRSGELESDTT